MKLSIIVPVYNVEQYIGSCLESVFRQELCDNDYEVIVVNDGTCDRSMEVVAEMQAIHHNIYIIEQQNQGLSVARNKGLDHATGQYVLFLDSDDLLIDGTLPRLLQTALDTDADMALGDFVKMDDEAIQRLGNRVTSRDVNTGTKVKEDLLITFGKEYFLQQFDPHQCFVWRMLYKRQFLTDNSLRFIPGLYFEDVPFTTECYLRVGKCVRERLIFHVYRQRANSIVSTATMKKLTDLNTVTQHLCEMKSHLCTTPELRHCMDDVIFITFSNAVWYLSHDKNLLADRRTFINDLRQKVPGLRFSNGLKQRLVSVLFRFMPRTYVWLRSL